MSQDFTVTLKQLVISPENVRALEDTDTTTLQASLLAHTQLHPLVVREKSKGKYEVIAGRRRFLAFERLIAAKKLTKDFPIKVTLLPEALIAGEVSLAENVEREAMHPVDEFETFRKLIEEKHETREAIAERFGLSVLHINRRLKLAKVAPEILKVYRLGSLTLAQVEAFALSDDQDQQAAYYASASHWNLQPEAIRRAMKAEALDGSSKLAKFVGEEAYVEAGGTLTRDLFVEHVYFDDAALLERLAREKLTAIADEVRNQGPWKWVTAEPSIADRYTAYPSSITGEASPLTEDEQAAAAVIDAEIEALEAKIKAREEVLAETCQDDGGEVDEAAFTEACDHDTELEALYTEKDTVFARHEAAMEAQAARPRRYDPQEMQLAGVLISIGHAGKLDIAYGLVRKDDVKYLNAFREKRARIEQEKREQEREAERAKRHQAENTGGDRDRANDGAADNSINHPMADGDNPYDRTADGSDPPIGHSTFGAHTEDSGNENGSPDGLDDADTIDLDELKESVDSGESHPLHLPMALNGELSYHLTNALRAELALNPEIAIRVLAYTFALSILNGTYVASCPISDLKIGKPHVPKDFEGTESARVFATELETLRSRLPTETSELWAFILEIDRPLLDQILAIGFAETVTAHLFDKSPMASNRHAMARRVMEALSLDMGRWWNADETFFKRAGKKVALRALQEAGPLLGIEDPQRRDIEVAALSKLKTGEIAERAEHDLKDTGWLPHLLRTPGLPFNAYFGATEEGVSGSLERSDEAQADAAIIGIADGVDEAKLLEPDDEQAISDEPLPVAA